MADDSEHAPAFSRILLKLSGEALMGRRDHGLDPERVEAIVSADCTRTGTPIFSRASWIGSALRTVASMPM